MSFFFSSSDALNVIIGSEKRKMKSNDTHFLTQDSLEETELSSLSPLPFFANELFYREILFFFIHFGFLTCSMLVPDFRF